MVSLKIVPRIEVEVIRRNTKDKIARRSQRIPAKLFNPDDHKSGNVIQAAGYYQLNNDYFTKDGYLEKEVKRGILQLDNVPLLSLLFPQN